MSSNYFNIPQFYNESYLPSNEILNFIKKSPDLPLTLITGKTIHNKNLYLPNYGYGLPILPLEQFNILNIRIAYFLTNKKGERTTPTFQLVKNSKLLPGVPYFFKNENIN